MAFPSIRSQTTGVNQGSNATVWSANLPATINSGDLILVLMSIDGAQVVTVPSGWTQIASNTRGSVARGFIMGKVADGTEDSTTVSVTIGATGERGVIDAMAIQDWGGNIADVESSTTNNNGANDDPPSLTPSWGSDDTLWLACRCADGGTMQSTAYPTNYTLGQSTQGAGGAGSGASGSVCGRQLAAATENPGAFTNPSSPSSIYTVAVKPAAGGATVVLGQESTTALGSVTQSHSLSMSGVDV